MLKTENEIFQECINEAVDLFIEEEWKILEMDVSERCITHILANYIKEAVGDEWDVDIEYNRHQYGLKKENWEPRPRLFLPDIIVHKRNTGDNLLAVELKKSTNKTRGAKAKDKDRLRGMVSSTEYHYKHGLFVCFPTGKKDYGLLELEKQWFP